MGSQSSREINMKPLVPKEYDSHERMAKVWLYDCNAGLGKSFTYRHWILLFEFDDKSVRVIEGVKFKGKLIPSFRKVNVPNLRQVSIKGTIRISPTRIRDLVLKNPYNGKLYDALICNCQIWLNWILKELGLAKEITAGAEVKWTLLAIRLSYINPFVGAGVYVGRQLYKYIYNSVKRRQR